MIAMSPAPSTHKRPRGLWKGRREAALHAEPEPGIRSHDHDDLEHFASTSTHSFDSYYDDFDDDYSDLPDHKRRRLSGGLSDSETLWHHSPASRSLTPDPNYNAPCFPSQLPKTVSDFLNNSSSSSTTTMHCYPSPLDKFASINKQAKRKQPATTTDIEDWQNLKGLFASAYHSYQSEDVSESLPLLRAVIRECHRFLLAHPDPSVVFVESHPSRESHSPDAMTPSEERLLRDWAPIEPWDHSSRRNSTAYRPESHAGKRGSSSASPNADPPTAFHAIFGTTLYLMGTIIAGDPSLALSDEPNTPSTYWLAALDVFETGENLPSVVNGRRELPEDWRMAVSWGRTLICIAEEKLEHTLHPHRGQPAATPTPQMDMANGWCAYQPSAGPFSASEPRWPPSSPFHAVAVARPPVTRRMSLFNASAHDVMVLAMDQFSRGIFHMPHPHYPHTHNPTGLQLETPFVDGHGFSSAFHSRRHTQSSATPPPAAVAPPPPPPTLEFSRPKELYTIASEVLGIAERLPKAGQREYWAGQADSVFNQMKMEADMDISRAAVNAARGRCWLVVGEARAEELEGALERGDVSVLHSAEAEDAREGLAMAVTFFERAKGTAKSRYNLRPDDGELSPLLAETLVTLANLTAEEGRREALYARAQREAGDMDLGLEPPEEEDDAGERPASPSSSIGVGVGSNVGVALVVPPPMPLPALLPTTDASEYGFRVGDFMAGGARAGAGAVPFEVSPGVLAGASVAVAASAKGSYFAQRDEPMQLDES